MSKFGCDVHAGYWVYSLWARIGKQVRVLFAQGRREHQLISYIVPQNFVFCMPKPGHPWDLTVLANCNHLKIPGLVHGAINCVSDIVLFVLPLPVIAKLHVSAPKKFAISAIFGSALLGLICSILGIYYRVMISYGHDPVWANAQAFIVV